MLAKILRVTFGTATDPCHLIFWHARPLASWNISVAFDFASHFSRYAVIIVLFINAIVVTSTA